MKIKYTKIIALLFCFYLIDAKSIAFAQEITLKQTLDYLNSKFEGKYKFDTNKGGTLYLEAYKNGRKYKDDIVKLDDLDVLSIAYSEEEKAFVIKCLDGFEGCINRSIYDLDKKTKNTYSRMTILYEGNEKSIEGIKNAFTHMIRLISEPKYHSSEPFEK